MLKAVDFGPKLAAIDNLPGRKRSAFPEIRDSVFWELYEASAPFSLLHVPGFYNLFQSMNYVARNKLAGDIVECGCFLGGVGIFMALLRDRLQLEHKTIYLFDSFQGFPAGETDAAFDRPVKAMRYADTESDVRDNIRHAAGNCDRIELVRGFVEDTLPKFDPRPLCLLRLDTDFYNSTRVELELLYEHLMPGGVLIIDDYGMFEGSRRATDEFFSGRKGSPLLNRVDRAVWAGVKPCYGTE